MKRVSVSELKHADAPFLYFFSRLANLLFSASHSTGFKDTLKSFLKKIRFWYQTNDQSQTCERDLWFSNSFIIYEGNSQ